MQVALSYFYTGLYNIFRTIRFPAILIYSILGFAWLYLVYLRIQNWWILQKIKVQSETLDVQSNHENEHEYNTHDKNPIIFNAKGNTYTKEVMKIFTHSGFDTF